MRKRCERMILLPTTILPSARFIYYDCFRLLCIFTTSLQIATRNKDETIVSRTCSTFNDSFYRGVWFWTERSFCTSSRRIIKLGNKPKNPRLSPVGTHSTDIEIPFGKNPLRRTSFDRRPSLISKKINEAASASANFARARLISLL